MVSINMTNTGKNIKRLIDNKNISVKDLSDKFGFDRSTYIYKWIRGEALPSIDNLFNLADILNCTVDEIIVVDSF